MGENVLGGPVEFSEFIVIMELLMQGTDGENYRSICRITSLHVVRLR